MTQSDHRGWLRTVGISFAVLASIWLPLASAMPVHAQQADQEFDIQVTPATLSVTLKPGVVKKATVGVRNLSNHSEVLKPRLSGFTINQHSQKVQLDYKPPVNMAEWVTFNQRELSLKAGESKNLEITYDTPTNVGFSYAAAITLGRANDEVITNTNSGASLKGTVAIFNLINIDRPGAKRELTVESFKSSRGTYEFLPATFTLTIKNTGNVIDQPSGNVFIQRSAGDAEPISTLSINPEGNYILPGNSRDITVKWQAGFPSYKAKEGGANGDTHLVWDWKNANDFRLGRYVAKTVLVYNDGQRDIPVITSVSFWVLPWRIIVISLILIIVLLMGLFGWGRLIALGTKKVRRYAVHK
ncbi:MAG TPA: hypothetical protein VLE73_02970 [Candidatus Saccharimonadales bacterium]|nr:hypothetical protein [Candidatus Saccharimonadales bacterium]